MEEKKKRFEAMRAPLHRDGKFIHPRELLKRAAILWPEREALICGDERVSFEQLFWRACVVATALLDRGLVRGARVLVFYENSIDFYVAYHAAWLAGAVVVPLNSFLQEDELVHIVHDARPDYAFVSSSLHDRFVRAAPDIKTLAVEELLTFGICHEELFVQHKDAGDSLAVLLYTSGTTGVPKGVMLSGAGLLTNALQAATTLELGEHERVLAALPLFHSYMQNTCVWSPLLVGATVIIVPKITRKALLKGFSEHPTAVLGIPQLFGLLCRMRDFDFSTVTLCFCGGDALHAPIKRAFELVYGRRLSNGYGLTEMGPLIAVNLFDGETPEYCVGEPVYGVAIQIRSEDGHESATGEVGEVWVHGENVMMGYYQAPEATNAILQDGWLNTGDLGWCTARGELVISGRSKDLIINKGINIYPQEIEAVISRYPGVLQVAVVGVVVDDEEVPVAFVMSEDETLLSGVASVHLSSY
ncbi:TPA: hypothetical protein DCW54_01120, partial [Candidatus Dependentiae bacterium]|nr:hypothetical protein [Candidatus Dependentiae bacterium]